MVVNGEALVQTSASRTRAEGIIEAAWRLEDTLGKPASCLKYPTGPAARSAYLAAAEAEVQYNKALVAMLVLSVFETPAWCGQQDVSFFDGVGSRCSFTEKGDEILLSGVAYVPLGWGLIIELLLMVVMARKFWLERRVQVEFFDKLTPRQEYYSICFINFGFCMLCLELVDMVFFVAFRPRFRLAFLARTGYLCLLPAIINLAKLVYSCLWEFFSVATFLIGAIVVFAWIAVMIFEDYKVGNKGFDSFPAALYSMFVAGVSDDFVAVFLESYTTHRWVGLVWLLFLIIAHVLLLSLVLDTLVAAYMLFSEKHSEEQAHRRVKGILKSFRVLAASARDVHEFEVGREGFLDFIKEYGRSPRVVPVEEEKAEIMFAIVDQDHSGLIDYEEFCSLCRVVQYRFWCTRKDSFLGEWCPRLFNSAGFVRFREFVAGPIEHPVDDNEDPPALQQDAHAPPCLEVVMNYVLLANLGLVVLETSYDLNKLEEPASFDTLELLFSLTYVFEILCKLFVISFSEYWSHVSNQFDFFSTVFILGSNLIEHLVESNISTYAFMLRLLRLLRVIKNLRKVETVQFMVKTISQLLLTAKDILTFLGCVVFFFTMLSCQTFGGELHEGQASLEGSEYLEEHQLVLNANDVPMAFGIWVVMLLCEYEPTLPDAVSRVSTIRGSWIMFPIFYVAGVSIVFELVKAFTIEVFITLFKERKGDAGEAKQDAFATCLWGFKNELLKRGENLHYRASGSDSSQREVQEALEEMEHEAREHGDGGKDALLRMLERHEAEAEKCGDGLAHGHDGPGHGH